MASSGKGEGGRGKGVLSFLDVLRRMFRGGGGGFLLSTSSQGFSKVVLSHDSL